MDRSAKQRLSRSTGPYRFDGIHLLGWSLVVAFVTLIVVIGPLYAQPDSTDNGNTAEDSSASTPDDSNDGDSESQNSATNSDNESRPNGGDRRAATIPQSPSDILERLGWVTVAPFLLASFIALWFGIERLVVLRRGRVIPRPFVERFLQHLEQGKLDPDEALALCEENGSPVAHVFAHGVRKWGKPSVEVEQAIIDGGERQVSQLRKHLRVLNGVATVTPLMGLLGTVIGMIRAFNDLVEAAGGGQEKNEVLAVGISLALLTTAAGLLIAIPALILYMYLAGRVDALVMEMDHRAQQVVHLISAEALANKPIVSTRTRSTRSRESKSSRQQKEAV